MILVDSSVWIDYFNGIYTPQTEFLHNLVANELILVGDIILGEVLQGFQRDEDFSAAREAFDKFEQVGMLSPELAVQSALNYRSLRRRGITTRKTIDCFIATYCIESQHTLLHSDRDFDPFEIHLGLSVLHPYLDR